MTHLNKIACIISVYIRYEKHTEGTTMGVIFIFEGFSIVVLYIHVFNSSFVLLNILLLSVKGDSPAKQRRSIFDDY